MQQTPLVPVPPARGLPKTARLSDGKIFLRLLQGRRRAGDCLELAYLRNETAAARLGVVVGKKNLPSAVDRNSLKRIVREAFRAQRAGLPPCDVLIRLRQSLKGQPRPVWKARVVVAVQALLGGVKV